MLGQADVEPSKLVVVFPENDLGKHKTQNWLIKTNAYY